MIKKNRSGMTMIETLESRRLLSSVTTISADVTQLKTDLSAERSAVKTLKTDLLSSITTGTAGLTNLVKDLKHIHTYGQTAKTALSVDVAVVVADKGLSSEVTAEATLGIEVAAVKTKLKTDLDDVSALVTKHPTLISASVKLTTDAATVQSDYTTIKADISTLQAAL